MQRWHERGITVELVHAHVMRLHTRFLDGLRALSDSNDATAATASPSSCGGGGITLGSLHSALDLAARSHTLVFAQPSAAMAQAVVETLRRDHRLEVDSRKTYVRIGFGFNHNPEDVDRLIRAVEALHAGDRASRHQE